MKVQACLIVYLLDSTRKSHHKHLQNTSFAFHSFSVALGKYYVVYLQMQQCRLFMPNQLRFKKLSFGMVPCFQQTSKQTKRLVHQ